MKKLNQKGFTHLALVAVVAVVLGAVGFAGFKVYQSNNNIDAKAANWHTIFTSSLNGLTIKACYVNSGSTKFYVLNNGSSTWSFTNPSFSVAPHSNSAARTVANPTNMKISAAPSGLAGVNIRIGENSYYPC